MIQQIGGDIKGVIAVGCRLVLLSSDGLDVILTHQTTYASVPDDLQSQLLQLFSHTGPAITLHAEPHHVGGYACVMPAWLYEIATNMLFPSKPAKCLH